MMSILRKDFKTLTNLSEYQIEKCLPAGRISKHISLDGDNVACDGHLVISEIILEVFEKIRSIYGKPIHINSGYRTQEKQTELINVGYKAAKTSPHCRGFALDISAVNERDILLTACRQVSKEYAGLVRIGWKTYWQIGQSFIHIDIAPAAYKALKDKSFPEVWKQPYSEW